MRNTSLFSLCVVVLIGSILQAQTPRKRPTPKPTQPTSTAAEDREAIQELDDKEVKANLAFDVPAIEALWDPEIISIPPGHAVINGPEANHGYLEQQAKEMANFQILGYVQNWQEVRVLGDYAYQYGTVETRVGPMNPGPEVDSTYNVMRILKKQPDGAFKIYRTIWNSALPAKGTDKSAEPIDNPAEPPAEKQPPSEPPQ